MGLWVQWVLFAAVYPYVVRGGSNKLPGWLAKNPVSGGRSLVPSLFLLPFSAGVRAVLKMVSRTKVGALPHSVVFSQCEGAPRQVDGDIDAEDGDDSVVDDGLDLDLPCGLAQALAAVNHGRDFPFLMEIVVGPIDGVTDLDPMSTLLWDMQEEIVAPQAYRSSTHYVGCCAVLDDLVPDGVRLHEAVQRVVNRIVVLATRKSVRVLRVYVACLFGRCRSAAAAALLVHVLSPDLYPTWRDAFAAIQDRRPGTVQKLDPAFARALDGAASLCVFNQ